MTWTLDYDKTSDFDDVSGHWHLEDHPKRDSATRVYYACDIRLAGSVPGPILNYISKAALKQATGWVKRESENSPSGSIPAEFGGKGTRSVRKPKTAPGEARRFFQRPKFSFVQNQ